MKNSGRILILASALGACVLFSCEDKPANDLKIEKLPVVSPSLPAVPTIPPPPFPITYQDNTYSVYGVRRKSAVAEKATDVQVTGFIVNIYQPEECKKGQACPRILMPHIWIADTAGETDPTKRMLVTGYAQNQKEIDDAKAGRGEAPPAETGIAPVPTDFAVGNKIKLKGKFTRLSSTGFNDSHGLMEYSGHETLSAAAQ